MKNILPWNNPMQHYGQHFLKNKDALQKIASALNMEDSDILVEIGPGHGELTEELRNKNSKVKIICIEKDPSLIPVLKNKFAGDPSVEIKEGDALFVVPELLKELGNKIKLVGNIPYYITGFLFRKIGESETKPLVSVFTIQKEVALRIAANAPHMNRLAASIQAWADPKVLFTISKGDFEPRPQVDSAVIYLKTKDFKDLDLKKYFSLVKIVFQQPRKTIINNLSAGIEGTSKANLIKALEDLGLNPEKRPQDLRPEDLFKISSNLKLDK